MKTVLDILSKIWSNPNTRTFFLLALLVVFIILYWNSCQKVNEKNDLIKQNEEAYKNEITVEKNKNGDLQSSVVVWEGKAKDLDKYSKDLADELEAVKKSKVQIITKTVIKYSPSDTVVIDNTIDSLESDEYKLNWGYMNSDSSRILQGESHFFAKLNAIDYGLILNPGKTYIIKDEISIVLITGVKHNNKTGLDEIFVTPKTPGVSVTGLEGAILNPPKKKKISVTVGIGYGLYMSKDLKLGLGPNIGIIIGKPIFSF